MHNLKNRVFNICACLVLFSTIFFPTLAFANNPPDPTHSTISATSAPADGQTAASITVTLQDSSNPPNPLSGDSVYLSFSTASNDGNASPGQSSPQQLDSSGRATFNITSSTADTYNINVTDSTSNITLNNFGQVVFSSSTPSPSPNSCTDSAPGSTPQLTSAVANGTTQITLTWTQASDPVTYYLIAYGLTSGQYIYGNPNVGGRDTRSYTVSDLAKGTTYYFIVKAVNGCMPGSYSNEVSATTTGGAVVNQPSTTNQAVSSPTPSNSDDQNTDYTSDNASETPSPTPSPSPQVIGSLLSGFTTKEAIYIIGVVLLAIVAGVFFFRKFQKGKRPKSFEQQKEPSAME